MPGWRLDCAFATAIALYDLRPFLLSIRNVDPQMPVSAAAEIATVPDF
jgi:hypothetical protein